MYLAFTTALPTFNCRQTNRLTHYFIWQTQMVPSCHATFAVIHSPFKFEGEKSGCGFDSLLRGKLLQRATLIFNQIKCEMKTQGEYTPVKPLDVSMDQHCTKILAR